MALTTLTKREREWKSIARRAVENGEAWERCDDCLRYHPVGYEGECENDAKRLPARPEELVD